MGVSLFGASLRLSGVDSIHSCSGCLNQSVEASFPNGARGAAQLLAGQCHSSSICFSSAARYVLHAVGVRAGDAMDEACAMDDLWKHPCVFEHHA